MIESRTRILNDALRFAVKRYGPISKEDINTFWRLQEKVPWTDTDTEKCYAILNGGIPPRWMIQDCAIDEVALRYSRSIGVENDKKSIAERTGITAMDKAISDAYGSANIEERTEAIVAGEELGIWVFDNRLSKDVLISLFLDERRASIYAGCRLHDGCKVSKTLVQIVLISPTMRLSAWIVRVWGLPHGIRTGIGPGGTTMTWEKQGDSIGIIPKGKERS